MKNSQADPATSGVRISPSHVRRLAPPPTGCGGLHALDVIRFEYDGEASAAEHMDVVHEVLANFLRVPNLPSWSRDSARRCTAVVSTGASHAAVDVLDKITSLMSASAAFKLS